MENNTEYTKVVRLLESLTPGGSEFVNDPKRCAEFVKEQLHGIPKIILPFKLESNRLKQENKELVQALEDLLEQFEKVVNPKYTLDEMLIYGNYILL